MERSGAQHWNDIARKFLGEEFFAGFEKNAEEKSGPSADVYHNGDEVIVLVELPGVEDIQGLEITVHDSKLKIKGTMANPYHGYELRSSERQMGDFEKTIALGVKVSSKYTSAKYRRGILELRFPTLDKVAAKKINLRKKHM